MPLTQADIDQRAEWIEELGFTKRQAFDLARARDGKGFLVEVHAIRNALERDCDHATAFSIFA